MTSTVPLHKLTDRDRRLVEIAMWAAGEDVLRRLGFASEWDQGSWISPRDNCGTACCIAGKVALEDGLLPVLAGSWATDRNDIDSEHVVDPSNGQIVSIPKYAAEALGLAEDYDADEDEVDLFGGSNTIDDIIEIVGGILDRETEDSETMAARRGAIYSALQNAAVKVETQLGEGEASRIIRQTAHEVWT